MSRGFSLAWLLAFTKSFVLLASGMIVSLFFIRTRHKEQSNFEFTTNKRREQICKIFAKSQEREKRLLAG